MAIGGSLNEMSLSALIQMICNEGIQARLELRRDDQAAFLYFDNGELVHAEMEGQTGEEVVYDLLTWEEGEFELAAGVPPPARTISTSWSRLLLEGAHRVDEQMAGGEGIGGLELDGGSHTEEEAKRMPAKKRSELIADALSELLASSTDIEGGALVGIDGLVLSANVPIRGIDETIVGAAAAAIFGLSRRSVGQLGRGDFFQTLIQGSDGNIIVTAVDDRNVFVGITPADTNLGMVFHEARQVAQKLSEILK